MDGSVIHPPRTMASGVSALEGMMRKIVWKGRSLGGLHELRVDECGDVEENTYRGWTIDVCNADRVYALQQSISAIALKYGSVIEPVA